MALGTYLDANGLDGHQLDLSRQADCPLEPVQTVIAGTPTIMGGGAIVVGSGDGKLYKLEHGETGETISRRVKTSDGWGTEIISVTTILHTFNYSTGGAIKGSPSSGSLDLSGTEGIVFGSSDKNLYIMYSNGTLIKRYTTSKAIESTPAMGNLDGLGVSEIVFGDNEGKIWIIDTHGTLVFEYFTSGAIKSGPALADLTGDGTLEILVSSNDGSIYVFGDRRGMDISRAENFFKAAKRFFTRGDTKLGQESIDNARTIFVKMDNSEGVIRIENYLRGIDADRDLKAANAHYKEGDFEEARYILESVIPIYTEIGDDEGIEGSKRLQKLIEADLYFKEAQYFYANGFNTNASIYVTASRTFYRDINHTEGLMKTLDLMNQLKTEGKAETYVEDGLIARKEGRIEDAKMFFGFAKLSYELADNEQGIERMGEYSKSLDALELFVKAERLYNESEYENALAFTDRSLSIYGNLTADGYKDEVKSTKILQERIRVNIWAKQLYEQAQEQYLAASYEKAMEYANRSMILYKESGDDSGFSQARDLFVNSKTTHEMMTGSSGSRSLPVEAIAFSIILFAGWIVYTKGITPANIKNLLFEAINSLRGSEDEQGEMHIGPEKTEEEKVLDEEKKGIPSKKPARFGHRVVLVPKKKRD